MKTESVYEKKTYRITTDAIKALEHMTKRLSLEARIDLPMNRVIELLIFYCYDKPFDEIIR